MFLDPQKGQTLRTGEKSFIKEEKMASDEIFVLISLQNKEDCLIIVNDFGYLSH